MGIKVWLVLCLLCGALGAYLTYRLRPPVIVEHETIKDKIVTVTHVVHDKDGTVTEDETKTEDSTSNTAKQNPVYSSSSAEKPQWLVGATYSNSAAYGILVQRRILGPILVGIQVQNDRQGMLSIAVEF